MQVQVASLCDFATEYQGKLCLMGAFDSIYARELPVVQPCVLALRIQFTPDEAGRQKVRVHLHDAEGSDVFPEAEPEVDVNFIEGMPFVVRNLVLRLPALKFEKGGQYFFDIKSGDGEILTTLPVMVLQVQTQSDGQADDPGAGELMPENE